MASLLKNSTNLIIHIQKMTFAKGQKHDHNQNSNSSRLSHYSKQHQARVSLVLLFSPFFNWWKSYSSARLSSLQSLETFRFDPDRLQGNINTNSISRLNMTNPHVEQKWLQIHLEKASLLRLVSGLSKGVQTKTPPAQPQITTCNSALFGVKTKELEISSKVFPVCCTHFLH